MPLMKLHKKEKGRMTFNNTYTIEPKAKIAAAMKVPKKSTADFSDAFLWFQTFFNFYRALVSFYHTIFQRLDFCVLHLELPFRSQIIEFFI